MDQPPAPGVAPGPPGSGPSAHPTQPGAWISRRPPAPSFRFGSSISAIGPGCSNRAAAPDARSSTIRARRLGASRRIRSMRSSSSASSPVISRVSSSAVSASSSSSASATASFTVRVEWPSTNPASHSGYHSADASSRRPGARRRPECNSITSMSEPGQSSRRAYEPSATSAHPPRVLNVALRSISEWSTRLLRARPKAGPRSVVVATSSSRAARSGLERVGSGLTRADPPHLLDGHYPHLAVTDLACARGLEESAGHAIDVVVVDQDLDPHLRDEVDRVLGAAIHLGVAALAPEPLDVGHGEALDSEVLHRVLHVIDFERLDDPDDELHLRLQSWRIRR